MTRKLMLALALLAGLCGCGRHVRARNVPGGGTVIYPTGTASTMKRQVINAVDAGDGDYRIRLLRARMAADPDNLQTRMELARLYQQAGFPEVAVEHYRLAAARFPDSDDVHLGLARCLMKMNLPAAAAQGLEGYLASHAQAPAALSSWLGMARDQLGDWQRGEAAHRAALARGPDSDVFHNNLGYNLLEQKRYPEAATEFRRALALRPESVIARNNLGLALASTPVEAIREWSTAADAAAAHNNLAAVLIEQGKYADARKELETALGYTRNHPAALSNLKLVSELEERPASMPVRQETRAWKRYLGSAWRLLVGSETRR